MKALMLAATAALAVASAIQPADAWMRGGGGFGGSWGHTGGGFYHEGDAGGFSHATEVGPGGVAHESDAGGYMHGSAANGYGAFEWVDHLRWIRKPMLVIAGRYDRTCTLARSQEIHDEVEGSALVVIEKAAHMTYVEQPKAYLSAVRSWFISQGVLPDPTLPTAA